MVDGSSMMEVEKLISFSNDLVHFLQDDNDVTVFKHGFEQSDAFQSQSHSGYNAHLTSIQDYEEKIDAYKQRIEEAESEAAAVAEIDRLQKELEPELQREQLLREELRVIGDVINDLDHERVSIEEKMQLLKKFEQDQLRAEMKLSLYASVTRIIPNLDDQSGISGYIVERDTKVVESFQFDAVELNNFDSCNSIWKMINL